MGVAGVALFFLFQFPALPTVMTFEPRVRYHVQFLAFSSGIHNLWKFCITKIRFGLKVARAVPLLGFMLYFGRCSDYVLSESRMFERESGFVLGSGFAKPEKKLLYFILSCGVVVHQLTNGLYHILSLDKERTFI